MSSTDGNGRIRTVSLPLWPSHWMNGREGGSEGGRADGLGEISLHWPTYFILLANSSLYESAWDFNLRLLKMIQTMVKHAKKHPGVGRITFMYLSSSVVISNIEPKKSDNCKQKSCDIYFLCLVWYLVKMFRHGCHQFCNHWMAGKPYFFILEEKVPMCSICSKSGHTKHTLTLPVLPYLRERKQLYLWTNGKQKWK